MTENEIFRLYEPSHYRLVCPTSRYHIICGLRHRKTLPSVFSMKNIRLYIIGCSLTLTLWMAASFTAQTQRPAPATSQPAVPSVTAPVASAKPIEKEHERAQISKPLARIK